VYLEFGAIRRHNLSLTSGPGVNKQNSHLRLNDVRAAEVANSEHEAQLALTAADDSAAAELEGASSLLRPDHLQENQADLFQTYTQ
jgi:hypothetical protein